MDKSLSFTPAPEPDILAPDRIAVVTQLPTFQTTYEALAAKNMVIDLERLSVKLTSLLSLDSKEVWHFTSTRQIKKLQLSKRPQLQQAVETQIPLVLYKLKNVPMISGLEAKAQIRIIIGLDKEKGNIVLLEAYFKEHDIADCHEPIVVYAIRDYVNHLARCMTEGKATLLNQMVMLTDPLTQDTGEEIISQILTQLYAQTPAELASWHQLMQKYTPATLRVLLEHQGNGALPSETASQTQETIQELLRSQSLEDRLRLAQETIQSQKVSLEGAQQKIKHLEAEIQTGQSTLQTSETNLARSRAETETAQKELNLLNSLQGLTQTPLLKMIKTLSPTPEENQLLAGLMQFALYKKRRGEAISFQPWRNALRWIKGLWR